MLSYDGPVDRSENRLRPEGADRREFPRGGRRIGDKPGRHPTIAIIEGYEGVRRPCARYLEYFSFDIVEAGPRRRHRSAHHRASGSDSHRRQEIAWIL